MSDKLEFVPVEHIESGSFQGGEEDASNAEIQYGEDCFVVKKEVVEELKRLREAIQIIANYDNESIWFDDRDDAADNMLEIARKACGNE